MNKPKEIDSLAKFDQSHWQKIKSSSGSKEYLPKLVDLNPKDQKKSRIRKYFIPIFICLLILILLLFAILIPILILRQKSPMNITNFPTLSTRRITKELVNCSFPSLLNVDGRCINVMIDSNNCGSIGNQCLNNSHCSAGICLNVPGIQLNNSITIFSSSINGSADDQMFNETLPWNITLYNTTTNHVTVTTNGVLCLGLCSTAYTETMLPSNIFIGATVFPYWDDLYIYINTSQGIYYQSEGDFPNRKMIFEYYMSHYLQPHEFYHFQIFFFENSPGIVQFKYFDATDQGISCTIGVQASSNGPFLLYSYDRPNSVQRDLSLSFDTNLQTFNQSFFT